MEQVKVSTLIKMLQEHLEKYGDDNVMIYDDYQSHYKTFDKSYVSRTHGNRFVITCDDENS